MQAQQKYLRFEAVAPLTQTASDPCIYYRKAGKDIMSIGVYVDNIFLVAKNEKQLKQVKEDLSNKFNIRTLVNSSTSLV